MPRASPPPGMATYLVPYQAIVHDNRVEVVHSRARHVDFVEERRHAHLDLQICTCVASLALLSDSEI
jgi:hypothetical protein